MDASTRQPDKDMPNLGGEERHEAERRSSPRAVVVHEAIRLEGEDELARPVSSLAWSGLAAGLSMGFSLMADGLLHAALPDAPWRRLVASLGYTVGFLVVVMGRQQLFTENTLTVILPLLHAPSRRTFGLVLRLWAVVFAANIVGTILFAAAAALTEIFTPEVRRAFLDLGLEAASAGFGTTILRAILAGWLIALMVWLLPGADNARAVVILIITYLVGLAGLAHVVAGSVEVAYAAMAGAVTWTHYLFGFLVPTLIGNVIGGVTFVAVLNHAQVVDEL